MMGTVGFYVDPVVDNADLRFVVEERYDRVVSVQLEVTDRGRDVQFAIQIGSDWP